jgi:hypothetical protein
MTAKFLGNLRKDYQDISRTRYRANRRVPGRRGVGGLISHGKLDISSALAAPATRESSPEHPIVASVRNRGLPDARDLRK